MHGKLNSNDYGPAVIITAGIMLGTSVIAVAMRLHQRWPWTTLIKLEDVCLVTALIIEISNVIAVVYAVDAGLGQHVADLSGREISQAKRALLANFALTPVTEGFATLSAVLLLRNITPNRRYRRAMFCLATLIMTWSIASVARYAVSEANGVAPLGRMTWVGFAVVSMLIQMALFISACGVIWPLQAPVSRRIVCILYFSLCLIVFSITAVRLVFTPNQSLLNDFTWQDANMVIILLIESNLSIISAAYPSVGSFINKVSTGFLVAVTTNDSNHHSKGGTMELANYSRHKEGSENKDRQEVALAPANGVGYTSTVVRGDARSDTSFGSEVIMVRQSVEIDETPPSEQ